MTDSQDALRKTIVARIATFDTSIPEPTPEQVQETLRLLSLVMEAIGEQHQDFPLMQKLASAIAPNGNTTAPEPPNGPDKVPSGNTGPEVSEDTSSDLKGGNVMPKQSWSAAAMDYLVKAEGFKPKAYPDPGGQTTRWAVGYGNQFHPGQKVAVRPGDVVDKAKAKEYMADAMSYNVGRLRDSVGDKQWNAMTGGQKLALTSWAYNVGEKNVRGSTLARRLQKGEAPGVVIPQELPKWRDGGLAAGRRAEELRFAQSDMYE